MSLDVDYTLTADAYALGAGTDGNDTGNNSSSEGTNGMRDGSAGDDNNIYDDAGREVDWIERAWDYEGDAGDKETARVLLDAMRDDAVLCAVTG
ncbi:hypothetical protein EKO27_g8283 [Xylaria grammica]|uniref:Uncharacterized protein n=1 Tax=Xylaria grammica TaxID=363999 RepID=A0A439CXA4_9PEZI|nr:hypothetical protein EKO27_g8283 [Xylaria grammica]